MPSHTGNDTCMTRTCVALETEIDRFPTVVAGCADELDAELTTGIGVLSSTGPLVAALVTASAETTADCTAPIASVTIDATGTICGV